MDEITVVGGGLAGLIAAVEVAEAGAPVTVLEARSRPGGRARSTTGAYQANLGPHALYTGTELWDWLRRRKLHRPARLPADLLGLRFRYDGEVRRKPPALREVAKVLRHPAPVDRDLRSWATERAGEEAARVLCGVAGPLTFDHDPGRLSAAFVVDKVRSILTRPIPTARYLDGGWGALVDRLVDHARAVGARIETGARLTSMDDRAASGPVIVAVEPPAARRLLADDRLRPEIPRVALLDLGLTSRRGDPFIVADLDEAAFVDRFSAVVPSLAPAGHELVQASVGVRPDEGLASGTARLEAVLDDGFDGWRNRLTWHRRGLVTEAAGAVDLPGTTWRDRAPVAYADGVWLAGDWVAAPGHLAEVSCTSAVAAAAGALAALRRDPVPAAGPASPIGAP